jgi:hypothetical protein
MFAASAQSRVFHLIERTTRRTMCGLKVSPFLSEKPEGERLHVIGAQPAGYSECKHCHRLQRDLGAQESIAGANACQRDP